MKKLAFLLILLPGFGLSQTCDTNDPATAATVPSSACLACAGEVWTNETNVSVADGVSATCPMTANGNCFQSSCYVTRFLYASHFGFTIPANATIDSIRVDILKRTSAPASAEDSIVQLSDGINPYGANLRSTALWNTVLTNSSYGQTDPLWSYTWTPAIINDTTFGVELKAMNISPLACNIGVDHIQVTICYTTPNGIYSITASPATIRWITSGNLYSATFELNTSAPSTQYIYTSDGKLVYTEQHAASSTQEFSFDPAAFSNGIYIWKIEAGADCWYKKIVIAE